MIRNIRKLILLSLIVITVLLLIPDFHGVFVSKVAFIIFMVFIAGFIFSNEEAKQERVNKVNERTNEDESCDKCTCDKDTICYRGHIIPVSRVYILLSINEGVNEYLRIDKVYNN